MAAVFRSQVGLVERYSDPGEQPGVALPACLACLSAVAFLWLPVPFPCRFCGSLLLPLCCACWALLRALCLLPCRLPGRAADEGQAHAGAGGRHTLQCGEAGGLPAAAAPVVPARLGTPAFRAVKARHAGPQPAPHSSSAASPLPHCACYAVPAMLCLQIRASSADRPRPLYYSTALNLGLHRARGQPCLLDYLLPPASPLPARRWLRRLLLLPPPPATAAAVHRACRILSGGLQLSACVGWAGPPWKRALQACSSKDCPAVPQSHSRTKHSTTPLPAILPSCHLATCPPCRAAELSESLPVFPMVPAASVVLKLRSREANDIFFREVTFVVCVPPAPAWAASLLPCPWPAQPSPALPCPALPCPALPCPALPCSNALLVPEWHPGNVPSFQILNLT